MKSLLVCSNSTKDFDIVEKCKEKRIVSSAPDISILEEMGTYENVVAIGGGAVIDTAKILSKNPITCYPTTAAGSSATSWSVYWDGFIYGLNENRLVCINALDGTLKWRGNKYGYGQIVAASGHLIILGDSGDMTLVEMNPNTFLEKIQFKASNVTINQNFISNHV